ncbi:MAG TPA: hypothetical protein VMD05_07005 [Candidatus Nanoarchaeia archaeon]|nr:hypothetical protein [Candidatus Nanoarchaeia archaeon]
MDTNVVEETAKRISEFLSKENMTGTKKWLDLHYSAQFSVPESVFRESVEYLKRIDENVREWCINDESGVWIIRKIPKVEEAKKRPAKRNTFSNPKPKPASKTREIPKDEKTGAPPKAELRKGSPIEYGGSKPTDKKVGYE